MSIYKYKIITLGCRVNQYESRAIAERLEEMGMSESETFKDCDLYVINTCAVTSESTRKSRQMIRRAAMLSNDPVVAVTGCWSELEPQKAAELGPADLIVGCGDKTFLCDKALELLKSRENNLSPIVDLHPLNVYDEYVHVKPAGVREFLKIEDGCNGKCSYCIISKARGRVRSRDPENAVSEAAALAGNGAKEIVLTGIELSGYQYDLASLIDKIAKIPQIERIRMGSLDPAFLTHGFIDRISKIEKVMPHFHLSVQSGCSRTLNAMRRKYKADLLYDVINDLRGSIPRIMLSCDLIVGFPGETESDLEKTIDFINYAKFIHAHIFPFSPRPGTEAASMPGQLTKSVKEERLKRIKKIQDGITSEILASVISEGDPLPVLVEGFEKGLIKGHSDNFIPVSAEGNPDDVNKTLSITPLSQNGDGLFGIK